MPHPPDLEFARRLERACDQAGLGGYGKQANLRRELLKRFHDNVSAETISKYFKGENYPGRQRLCHLAEILGISAASLSLGDLEAMDDSSVRIDPDVFLAARTLALQRNTAMGKLVSDLLRTALTQGFDPVGQRNGLPLLGNRARNAVTLDMVNALRDEAP
jgi:transcriptional regulator with XRE-family HTH domain